MGELPPVTAALTDAFAKAAREALAAPDEVPEIAEEWRKLGARAAGMRRIYLDKNVWIWLRDVELGRSRDPRHDAILTGLSELVATGSYVCPASDVLFVELLGQRDKETRVATARVVDRLASGLTLAPYRRRVELEFLRWVMGAMAPAYELTDPLESVWLPLPHLLGPMVPHSEGLPPEVNRALQYAWLRASSEIPLAEMVEMLPEVPEPEEDKEAFAQRMTEGKDAHAAGQTFNELYRAELEGGVDSFASELEVGVRAAGRILTGSDPGPLGEDAVRAFARSVGEAGATGKLGAHLPTLQVGASYHASVRADPARRYKPGDWLDAIHAATALPYCQLLFTESSLRHLLTTKPSALAERFDCAVYSNPTEMIGALECERSAS